MGHHVEDGRDVGTRSDGEEHEAQLADGGVGEDALDVVLGACQDRGQERGERAHPGHQHEDVGYQLEERERAAWLRKQRRQYTERDAALVGTPAALRQRLQALADAGVDFVGLGFVGPSLQSVLDRMALFAEEVMPAFADPAARAAGALGGAS